MSEHHLNHRPFENLGKQNGIRYWHARDLMHVLGYENYCDFEQIIQHARATCAKLDIPLSKNFKSMTRWIDGVQHPDYSLSRFACHLVTTHADLNKEHVLKMVAYFNSGLQAFMGYIHTARQAGQIGASHSPSAPVFGLEHFIFLQNPEHLNLYNMSHQVLRTRSDSLDEISFRFYGRDD